MLLLAVVVYLVLLACEFFLKLVDYVLLQDERLSVRLDA